VFYGCRKIGERVPPNDLADVATKIGVELRNQYVLGYRLSNPASDGKWHKLRVKLVPPKGLPPLRVYAKTGYSPIRNNYFRLPFCTVPAELASSTASQRSELSSPANFALKGNQFLQRPIIAFAARNKSSESPLSPVRLISQEADDEQNQN
jgi:hypothetical protein